MSNPVLFKNLPATFPEEDKYQKSSIVGSVVFHLLLITVVILFPLMFTQNIQDWQLKTLLVAPLSPPPAAAPRAPVAFHAAAPARPKVEKVLVPEPGALVTPVFIPRDIASVVDEANGPGFGVVGGVLGGIPGDVPGGVVGGIFGENVRAELALAPPPPPPPPPVPAPSVVSGPIRVGGNVREPQIIKFVPPIYPGLAKKALVTGAVVLEATLTDQGTVQDIRIISGHPLLDQAAIECVQQWVYEPTYLNGKPVSVILTARVVFSMAF